MRYKTPNWGGGEKFPPFKKNIKKKKKKKKK